MSGIWNLVCLDLTKMGEKSGVSFELLVERPFLTKIQVGSFWSLDFKKSSKTYLKANNLYFISVPNLFHTG